MQLTLDRLTKQYGSKIALDRIDATFEPGIYGLLGANGAGKTTMMRLICDILKPTSGEVTFNGTNIREMGESYRAVIGYLPQDFGYYPNFTAMNFLLYMASLKGLNPRYAKEKSLELLETLNLSEVKDKKIKTFSGGMKQRLGIAQALLNSPKILVLDEPTAGLDPKERVRFRNILSEFANDKIVLLSTHIVSDIEAIADQVFLMKKGSFVLRGSVEELVAHAQGKVWELTIEEQDLKKWELNYTVANLRHSDRGFATLRIISDKCPSSVAVSCEPSLEDLYLLYFPTEDGGQR